MNATLARHLVASLGLVLTSAACAGPTLINPAPGNQNPPRWSYQSDLEVTRAPYNQVHANWKQRLDQPYVFLELQGHYQETGRAIPRAHKLLAQQGLAASGPPFGLYYDDPGRVPVEALRSRLCIPVAGPVQPEPPLEYAVLPSTTVVYALIGGAYPEVPRAYPGLYAYLTGMGWVEAGPMREIYLVSPAAVADYDELLCEVQLPATYAP